METKKIPGAWDLFKETLNYYQSNWKIILGISSVPLVIGAPSVFAGYQPSLMIFAFAGVITTIFARLALISSITASTGILGVKDSYKKGSEFFISFLWMTVLSTLATFGGLLLLIVPGIIIGLLLAFSNFTLVIDGRKGISALTLSWAYVKGYWWPVFGRFIFAGILVSVVGFLIALPFASGVPDKPSMQEQAINFIFSMLVAVPLVTIYTNLIYKSLKEIKSGINLESEEIAISKKVKVFVILGIVSIFVAIALAVLFVTFALPLILKSIGTNMPSTAVFPFLDYLPK